MASLRRVHPGEVDHEIDWEQLDAVPIELPSEEERGTYEAIYRRWVRGGEGKMVPRAMFCDVSRSGFLDYVALTYGIRLMTGAPELAPVVLAKNLVGWDRPRHFGFSRSVEAILPAILDHDRLARLGRAERSTVVWPFAHPERAPERFYFGLDYRALSHAPWRSGVVHLFRGGDFPDDVMTRPFLSPNPILPLASVEVEPYDWPLLERIEGIAPEVLAGQNSFLGCPWRNDETVHPGRWKREPAQTMRDSLDRHPDEPADLRKLGRLVGLSPSAALRTFQTVYGRSPRAFSTHRRALRGRDRLRAGASITETAHELGFADQSHFTAQFRAAFGLTPGAYLRMQESPRPAV